MKPIFRKKETSSNVEPLTPSALEKCIQLIVERGWLHVDSVEEANYLVEKAREQGHYFKYKFSKNSTGSPHLVGEQDLFRTS